MQRITRPPKAELENLYAQFSLKELAQHYKVSQTTVSNWLDFYGIPKRPKGPITGRLRVEVSTEDLKTALDAQISKYGRPNFATLGKQFGMTPQGVRERLVRAGYMLPAVKHHLSPAEKKEVVQLYKAGATIEALAEQFNVSNTAIRRVLAEAGVTIRGRTDHMRDWHAEQKAKLAEAGRVPELERLLDEARKDASECRLELGPTAGKVRSLEDRVRELEAEKIAQGGTKNA